MYSVCIKSHINCELMKWLHKKKSPNWLLITWNLFRLFRCWFSPYHLLPVFSTLTFSTFWCSLCFLRHSVCCWFSESFCLTTWAQEKKNQSDISSPSPVFPLNVVMKGTYTFTRKMKFYYLKFSFNLQFFWVWCFTSVFQGLWYFTNAKLI